MTARELHVTRVCAKRSGRSVLPLSRRPGLSGFRGTYYPPRIPMPVCLGHRGPVGRSAWPWKGCQDSRPLCCAQDCKSKKPPMSRHRCKLRGFLYKLELESKCTRHSRAGIWTLRLIGIAALKGPVAHGIHRKLHSCVGPHAGGRLNYTLPYSST